MPHERKVTSSDDEDAGRVRLRLRECRIRQDVSQHELARRSGVSLRQIQRIERGAVSPRFDTTRRLAAALGIALLDLVVSPRRNDQQPSHDGGTDEAVVD